MPKTRYSKQRELIYSNLMARHDHPTAEAIYRDLKKDHPELSLGTVYRNLNFLADNKRIRKLDVGQKMVHFDGDLSNHHHFICSKCKKVFDINFQDEQIRMVVRQQTNHQIDKVEIVFSGVCESCLMKEKN